MLIVLLTDCALVFAVENMQKQNNPEAVCCCSLLFVVVESTTTTGWVLVIQVLNILLPLALTLNWVG